ncbi:hypothetical protein GCM10011410_07060 [Hoyosella rhizosphaerae]|uniref:Uncharacterized protein n=1 Tax=Hoyosella rhizosphaerae TaxID=1755582 RepID=A0A916XAT9_9ACTN|nr:hypothetical protein GCM10011410_07060 [Hoyosella rhizosphaerae]
MGEVSKQLGLSKSTFARTLQVLIGFVAGASSWALSARALYELGMQTSWYSVFGISTLACVAIAAAIKLWFPQFSLLAWSFLLGAVTWIALVSVVVYQFSSVTP